MKVAIIPARGGSQRIPRKNIKSFAGKPIIAWSIEEAIRSELFERVLVSTDDQEIADVARQCGAEVPFIRPEEISGQFTGTNEVIKHAIHWLEDNDTAIDYACCIYPTAPFIQAKYLKKAHDILVATRQDDSSVSYAFSVTSFPFPIQRAIRINEQERVEAIWPENNATRSQDLDEAFHDAGQFYWGTTAAFIQNRPLFSSVSIPVVLPRYLVQDIDTEEDWLRAEFMFKAMLETGELVR